MGDTVPLQKTITVRGVKASGSGLLTIHQPVAGWLDTRNAKDATIRVRIVYKNPDDANLKLLIQTGSSLAGSWKDLATYGVSSPPKDDVFGVSTGGVSASAPLERFLRWSIDANSIADDSAFAICFNACVTLK
jgi:hypothetical protein